MYTVIVENNISGIEKEFTFRNKEEMNKFLEGFDATDINGVTCRRDDDKEKVVSTKKL